MNSPGAEALIQVDDIMLRIAIAHFGEDDELVQAIREVMDGADSAVMRSKLDEKPQEFRNNFLAKVKQARKEESEIHDFLARRNTSGSYQIH